MGNLSEQRSLLQQELGRPARTLGRGPQDVGIGSCLGEGGQESARCLESQCKLLSVGSSA